MDGNIENLGKITFKVKLDDEYHDFVLEWSEESQCYEGQQLFKQLELITGIPIKYTNEMAIDGGPHPRPALPIIIRNREAEYEKGRSTTYGDYYVCNNLAKEVIRCKNELDCNRFILTFIIGFDADEHFYIYYRMITTFLIDGTECRRGTGFCYFESTKVMLQRMRSIITNDALNAQLKNELPDESDILGQDEIYMNFNVNQYMRLRCSVWGNHSHRHSHVYLRNRG